MPIRKKTAPASKSGNGNLTRVDWMMAGQALLCEEGIAGMRLMKLTKRLKVSTGSFYYHFKDMDDYLAQLANFFSADQVRALVKRLTEEYTEPRERILELARRSIADGMFKLDAAMRIWASSDKRAAASLSKAESVTLEFLKRAFVDSGFSPAEAGIRSRILLSVTIAHLFTPGTVKRGNFQRQTLDLLMEVDRSA